MSPSITTLRKDTRWLARFQRLLKQVQNSLFQSGMSGSADASHEPQDEPSADITAWTRHVHPNGRPYFVHEKHHVVTPDDITKEKTLKKIDDAIRIIMEDTIQRRINPMEDVKMPEVLQNITGDFSSPDPLSRQMTLAEDCELWVSLQDDPVAIKGETPREFAHHFIDHKDRMLLYIPRRAGEQVKMEEDHAYWEAFSRRPMHRPPLPGSVEDELLSALAHYASEIILGKKQTTSPFSLNQCEQLIALHETLKHETKEISGVRAWFVSAVLHQIWAARNTYYYGLFGAYHSVKVYKPPKGASVGWGWRIVDWCLLFLCFGTHERYRVRLNLADTNGGVHAKALKQLLAGSVQEWTDSNLLATVFVSANMAFLAVPTIQGTPKTFALISTFFSMASIIGGVHHLWKHRPKSDIDSEETPRYLQRAIGNPARITFTSVFLCLPLVFLLWSVISFAVGLLYFAFQTSKGVSLGFLASIVSVIVLVTFCVRVFFYRIWEEPDKDSILGRAQTKLQDALITFRKALSACWEALLAFGRRVRFAADNNPVHTSNSSTRAGGNV